jgi:autotransporter-associated beta strand protein
VTNPLDDVDDPPDGSLRFELERAPANGTVRIQIPSDAEKSTIDLDGLLRFEDSVTIDNSGQSFDIFPIVAPEQGSYIEVEDDVDLELRDVLLQGDSRSTDDFVDLQDATSRLIVNLSREDQTYNVDIVGSGALVKEGGKALTLTGENTFTGGITVRNGDVIGAFSKIAGPGMGTISLNPSGSSTTARIVFDISGAAQVLDTTPAITADESSGGQAVFVKAGSGDLDIRAATIDPEIALEIERGDLIVGAANLAPSPDIEIDSSGTLRVTSGQFAESITYGGRLSGEGTLLTTALAIDTLTLTGDLTGFSGDLEIEPSSIVAVEPADIQDVALPFSIDTPGSGLLPGVLRVDHPNTFDVELRGDMSGSLRLRKLGSGTTTLTGRASHTGGTFIDEGILVGNTDNLQRTLTVNGGAELHFDQSSAGRFDGSIVSPGGNILVRKLGSETLTLDATQGFAGRFEVDDGGLAFAPGVDLTNADLVIGNSDSNRGILSSDFVSGGSQAANTISIGGGLTLRDDSQFLVTLSDQDENGAPGRRSTLFDAAGAVVIGDGSTADSPELIVDLLPGSYTGAGTGPYTILRGGSLSVVEGFTVTEDLFYFDLTGGAVGNTFQVNLVDSGNTLENAASTHNQQEVGGALDNLRAAGAAGDPDLEPILEVLNTLKAEDVDDTLDGLSGDILSGMTNVRLAVAAQTWASFSQRFALARNRSIGHHDVLKRRRREVQRSRQLRGGPDGATRSQPSVDASPPQTERPWIGWFEARGLNGDLEADDEEGYGYKAVGPLIGADKAIHENVRVGFATAGTRYVLDADGSNNKIIANGVEGSVYGMWVGDPVEVLLGARYGHAWIESKRILRFDDLQRRVEDDFEGNEFGLYAEATRAFGSPSRFEIAPFASLAYHHVTYDDIDEDGGSPLSLEVDGDDIDSAATALGFRVGLEREMDEGVMIRPHLKAAWSHEWADVDREVNGEFVAGGGSQNLEGAELPRDLGEFTVGWEVGYNRNANVYIDWKGRFGEDLIENALSIGLRAAW